MVIEHFVQNTNPRGKRLDKNHETTTWVERLVQRTKQKEQESR